MQADVDRFWAKVRKDDGCWLWTGKPTTTGYGQFWLDRRRPVRAHRFSWEVHYGPPPAGRMVCHHCDNRRCVRPDHLFLGTASDNTRDAARKKRLAHQKPGWVSNTRGERQWAHKLTEAEAVAIIQLKKAGRPSVEIAKRYGVDPTTIRRVGRTSWTHLAAHRKLAGNQPLGLSEKEPEE